MTENPTGTGNLHALAAHADVKGVLGDMDDATMAAILALQPTVADVEEASMWLSGDMDVFGPGRPLKHVPGQIVALLTAGDEENAPGGR